MTSLPPVAPAAAPTAAPAPEVSRSMSQSDFFHWLQVHSNISFRQTLFSMHSGYLANEVQNHPFILDLSKDLATWDLDSQDNLGYPLLMESELKPFHRKSHESFLNKIYRTDCVYNSNFPLPPDGGWIDENSYLSRINDLIRNKISCKFIDGPEILAQKMVELANKHSLRAEYSSRNYDDGYYAYHFYVYLPIKIDAGSLPPITHDVAIEIQISTQLKEVMYEILHKFYADERSKVFKEDWKWDTGSLKFKSGYLSHTLHMLEAMIVELRNEI